MDWITIAGLLLKYGIPLTDFIIGKIKAGGTVTEADWTEAKRLGSLTPEGLFGEVLASKGIDPADPRAQAILALIKAS